jgi:hypothetical protein
VATVGLAWNWARGTFGTRLAVALENRRVRDAVVLVAYLCVTALWFHRLMVHYNDAVLYKPNDESYGIRQYWGSEYFHSTPFTQTRDPLNGAPEGLEMAPAIQIANALIPTTIWGLHYLFGFVGASNIFLLSGLVLTGFAFYALLDRLGMHPFAAFYAGYAVAFNPWMLERAGAGHSGFMQAWIFPVVIAVMLYARQHNSVRAAVIVGLTLALSFYTNSYYGLMAGLIFGIFWVLDIVKQKNWADRFWAFTMADIAFVVAVVAFVPALVAWRTSSRAVSAGISNGVDQVQSLGATTQAYFLPSFRHPLLSHITRHFYPQAAFVWSENTLYLGWSLIVIGLVGAYLVFRRDAVTFARPLTRYFSIAMVILVPAAFFFSLQRQTTWFGVKIPMPSYVISEFTTFWRVFARFGLLVTLALAALAAITLTALIRRHRFGWPIAIAALALLAFEYYDGVLPIYRLQEMPYSEWIGRQPMGIVANYPMPTDNRPALTMLAETYYQQVYNKHPQFMLFGSGYGETREDAIRDLVRYVTDPTAPAVLKAEGVKYVLLHDDVYREAGDAPPPIPAGFHLVARIPGDVRALEIDRNVKPADIPSVLEQNAASIAAVQGLPAANVTVDAPGGVVTGSAPVTLSWSDTRLRRTQIIVHAHTGGAARSLTLADDAGHTYGSWAIGQKDTQVSFGPLPVQGTSAHFTFKVENGGRVVIGSAAAQPLADFSVSIRDF